MSDNFLRLIPADPSFVPDPATAEQAREQLARIVPDAEEVTATTTDHIEFVDQGANFERVLCPQCRREIDHDWWGSGWIAHTRRDSTTSPSPSPAAARSSR